MAGDLTLLRQRLQKDPQNPLFRFSLAQALLSANETREAIDLLHECCQSRADWMVPRILLGRALIDLGRADEARPVLEDALKLAIEQRHEDPEHEIRELLAARRT